MTGAHTSHTAQIKGQRSKVNSRDASGCKTKIVWHMQKGGVHSHNGLVSSKCPREYLPGVVNDPLRPKRWQLSLNGFSWSKYL